MTIDCLPIEAFAEILTKVDGVSLGKCRRVSSKWREYIDSDDILWAKVCERDFKNASKIAKTKSGNDCTWYQIYRNLTMWRNVSPYEKKVKEFYTFNLHDKSHALSINSSILPLREMRGIILYDMSCLQYLPAVVPEKNCKKIAHCTNATVVLIKSGLLLHRTVQESTDMYQAFFKADDFVLTENVLYFFNNREIFQVDLTLQSLFSKLILKCDYDIKEIECTHGVLYIFTDCGKVLTIKDNKVVNEKPLNIPPEWIKQIKNISAIDDRNLVCYSRHFFSIETDEAKHLYLDFPPITALFFYGDIVLIGTKQGEILLYRLSSQRKPNKPIFETLAKLPDDKFAVQLDVCERKTGPVVVAATFFAIYIIEIDFFPLDPSLKSKRNFSSHKVDIYKRLLKIKDRLRCETFVP